MGVFAISTLQGTIIQVECDPNSTVVADFKQQCIEASPFHLSPLSVNVDLAHLMKDYDPDDPKNHFLRRYVGIRVVNINGSFMDDCKSIASQVSSWGEDEFMFKLVFTKQYNFSGNENVLLSKFAQGYSDSVVTMGQYGTQFIVMPVWGGADRPNHILGIFYKHARTSYHCQLAVRGVDPREVADGTAFGFDVDGHEVQPINFAVREWCGNNVPTVLSSCAASHALGSFGCQAKLQVQVLASLIAAPLHNGCTIAYAFLVCQPGQLINQDCLCKTVFCACMKYVGHTHCVSHMHNAHAPIHT